MKNVLQALLRASRKIEDPKKSKVNPAFKSKYVDLNSVLAAIGQALDEEGLVIVQTLEGVAGQEFLVTRLYHAESGEHLESSHPLPTGGTPQAFGSAMSYARRYSLMAMFNLGTADDDDGQAATDDRAAFLAKMAASKAAAAK
jgi:hypothetical protein